MSFYFIFNLHFFSGCMGDPFLDWWWWSFCWREVRDSYCWGSGLWWRGRRQPPYLWYQPSLVSSNKRAADWHWVSRICFLKYVLLIFLGFQTLIRLQLGQMAKRLIVFCFKIPQIRKMLHKQKDSTWRRMELSSCEFSSWSIKGCSFFIEREIILALKF